MNAFPKNRPINVTYFTQTRLPLSRLAIAPLVGLALLAAAPVASADCDCVSPWIIDPNEPCALTGDCTVEYLTIFGTLYTNGHTLTVTGGSGLVIYPRGRLVVNDGDGRVVLSGGGSSVVSGTIELLQSGSTLSIVDNDVTLIGDDGHVEGRNNSARIVVASGRTMTISSGITVEGSLEIRANSATFDNDGTVQANRSSVSDDTLTCYSGTFAGEGTYKVSTSGSMLWFPIGIDDTGLAADFEVTGGTLNINEDITTSGDYRQTGGTLIVASNTTFRAASQ